MPAGTGDPSKGVSGKTSGAEPDQEKIGTSLRNTVGQIDSKKHGQRSVIYIVVGPEVPGYEVDITVVPTMIHLKRDVKDSVEWRLEGGRFFTLQFVDESPFPKKEFDSKNNVGIVRPDADYRRYRYNLTTLTTMKGKKIEYGPPQHCPEIIIQR